MAMPNSTDAVGAIEPKGLAGFANNVVQNLREHEAKIADNFREGLRPDGVIMKLPDHMTERFRHWEESFESPEDLAKVAEVKRTITEMMGNTSDYVQASVATKTQRVQLELAMKAVSKGTQGIQQILSSQ